MEGTRLAEILREHHSVVGGGFLGPESLRCYKGCGAWPCEKFELATLAAQAEQYRTALAQRDAQWAAMPSGWRSIIRDRVARLEAGEEVVAAAALEKGAQG